MTIGESVQQGEQQEQRYFQSVCDSFRQYAMAIRNNRHNQAQRIASLPEKQKAVLPKCLVFGTDEWENREGCFREAELKNQLFFDSMLQYHGETTSQEFYNHLRQQEGQSLDSRTLWAKDEDINKAQSVLKSLARDWSMEMTEERNMCYKPILESVLKYIPKKQHDNLNNSQVTSRLVVPGAGVSRLALELSSLGYEVQGNEFSYHMLLASDFVLNACSSQNPFTIAPWLGCTKNVCQTLDTARQVLIPDVDPEQMILRPSQESASKNLATADLPVFSMGAGEFVSVYSKPSEIGSWNGVISCFFLDTAPSIIEYFQVIYDMLAEDGILINFGPLLYHWSAPPAGPADNLFSNYKAKQSGIDERYLSSVDLSWEDARTTMENIGFRILEEKKNMYATYTDDSRSLMSTSFRCIFFVARKSSSMLDDTRKTQL